MRHRSRGLNLLVFTLALTVVVGAQLLRAPGDVKADRVNPVDVCPDGGIKDDAAPWEATSATGIVIIGAVIKAGNETFEFTANGANSISGVNGCYTVTGLGTCHATVTGGGTGPDCKAISHVVFCFGPGDGCEPPPSPSPSPSPSPTP